MVKHTRRHKRRRGGDGAMTPEGVACANLADAKAKRAPKMVIEQLQRICNDAKERANKTVKGGRRHRRKTGRR